MFRQLARTLCIAFVCLTGPIPCTYAQQLVTQGASQASATQACRVDGSRPSRKELTVDRYGNESSARVLVFLHGSGGPQAHLDWIKALAGQNLLVLVPHYFEATGSTDATDRNYGDWAQAVSEAMLREKAKLSSSTPVSLLGYSLGASLALTLSTQCVVSSHVIAWEGSLPDFYFFHLRTLPHLLILHGQDDTVIPYSNALQLKVLCDRQQARCELKTFKGQNHVFSDAKAREAEADVLRFMDEP